MGQAPAGCGVEDERQLYPPRWVSLVSPALACLSSLHPPPRRAQNPAFLTHSNPALLSQAKTTPRASAWPGASSTPWILGLSFRNTVFPILPPHCFPSLLGLCIHSPLLTVLSLSLYSHSSLCLTLSASPVHLPCPLSVLFCSPLLSACPSAGEPPPRPPQPAIFTQSKWGCSWCVGPRPLSLSPLIPPLLEGTEPRWLPGWEGQ